MQKVLNQAEIDAIVRAMRSGEHVESPPAGRLRVESWDVRRAGRIGREQLQAITLLHEGFARNLTHSLGAYLRVVFVTTLVSAEHLTYREFLQRIPETTYLASCKLDPTGAYAALQLDLKVAFPMIDLLLGGEGNAMVQAREITEIEEEILDSVAHIICRELANTWQALSLQVDFEDRLESGVAQRLMPPEEKTLSLSFEVTMADVRGGLNLAVPATVSNALLRKISADWSHRRVQAATDSRQRLMRRLLECPFDTELAAMDQPLAVGALAQLLPGSIIGFERAASEPASLLVAGLDMYQAQPVRCAVARAAKLLRRTQPADGIAQGKVKAQ
jgi:flagellar motor switch protein FliM